MGVEREGIAARTRLAATLIAALIVSGAAAGLGLWGAAGTLGWAAGAAIYSGTVWAQTLRMDAAQTRGHATAENPGRTVADLIIVLASLASIGGVAVLMARSHEASGAAEDFYAVAGLASIAMSWIAVQTVFALRYAFAYYTAEPNGGVGFNQDAPPTYRDFAYLAFTVGMTFQVSDTTITSSAMRALVLRQALLAYVFGAVILATAINLAVSIGSAG